LPGWQTFYQGLKGKNFEIVSVAEDTGGLKDAEPWIKAAKPEYTALIDEKHLVTKLYGMVNVPTAVWIDEKGRIVRPNEVAFVDNRYKNMHGMDAEPYLNAIRDWVANGERSAFVLSEQEVKQRIKGQGPERAMADAEFSLAEYLYATGKGTEAIPHFKEAQRLDPDNWNYKRQAWALSNADRDYGTNWSKEVQKMTSAGKVYYPKRELPPVKKD
jgi:tetratricopeptide (TPR) repeat protein